MNDTHEINLTVKGKRGTEDTYETEQTASRESYEALKGLAERAKGESAGVRHHDDK